MSKEDTGKSTTESFGSKIPEKSEEKPKSGFVNNGKIEGRAIYGGLCNLCDKKIESVEMVDGKVKCPSCGGTF